MVVYLCVCLLLCVGLKDNFYWMNNLAYDFIHIHTKDDLSLSFSILVISSISPPTPTQKLSGTNQGWNTMFSIYRQHFSNQTLWDARPANLQYRTKNNHIEHYYQLTIILKNIVYHNGMLSYYFHNQVTCCTHFQRIACDIYQSV